MSNVWYGSAQKCNENGEKINAIGTVKIEIDSCLTYVYARYVYQQYVMI